MVIVETVTIGEHQYTYTHSDSGRYVVRDGISYDEVYDPIDSGRIYTEGERIPPEEPDIPEPADEVEDMRNALGILGVNP